MIFHDWLLRQLSDYEHACVFYDTAKKEFLEDEDLSSFEYAIDAIIEAQKETKSKLITDVYFVRAAINFLKKRYEEAAEDYQKVLEMEPGNTVATFNKHLAHSCSIEDNFEPQSLVMECIAYRAKQEYAIA